MHEHTKDIINRLSRIEGHVKSIKTMVKNDEPCKKVIMQLLAVKNAVISTSKVVLTDHIQNCSKTNTHNLEESLDELQDIILKYLK
jgi:DNA-binding FrmR family transcriptional regulator